MDPIELWQQYNAGLHSAARAGYSGDEARAAGLRFLQRNGYPSLDALQSTLRQSQLQQDVAPGKVAGTIGAFGRGASFGLTDEATGALDALLGGDYTQSRDAARAQQDAFAAQHPTLNAAGQLAGGLASTVATSGLLPPGATTYGGLLKQGAAIGAGAGGLTGFGESRANTLGGLAEDVGTNAALGGVLGSVAAPLTKLGATGVGAVARGARAVFNETADANGTARAALARLLPADVAERFARLNAQRPGEALLADVDPRLLERAGSKNTATRQAANALLRSRNAREGGLLASTLENAATGTVPGQVGPGIDAVAARVEQPNLRTLRARIYQPLEEQFRVTPDNPAGTALQNLLGTDEDIGRVFQQVVPKVERQAARAEMGRYQLTPGFKSFQSTLEKLQDDADAAFAGSRGNQGRKLAEAAGRLRTAMESAFPGFGEANQAYGSAKQVMDAQRLAQGALNRDPRESTRQLAQFAGNPDAQSAYRMQALDEMVAGLRGLSPDANAYREALVSGNQDMAPRLRALFPNPADLDAFLAQADVARQFRQTLGAMGGSETAGRADLNEQIFGSPGVAGRGSIFSRLGQTVANAARAPRAERVAEQLGNRLMTSGPEAFSVIDEILAQRAAQSSRDRLAGRVGVGTAQMAGRFPKEAGLVALLGLSQVPFVKRVVP